MECPNGTGAGLVTLTDDKSLILRLELGLNKKISSESKLELSLETTLL